MLDLTRKVYTPRPGLTHIIQLWKSNTRNIPAFGRMLNETLAPFETLPLTIYTEKDPEWNEYREMCELQDQDNDDEDLDE